MVLGAYLVKIIVGLLVLGVLIFVHELGHFLVAKLLGVGVLEFAIGFWKKLWSRRIGSTRYSLRLIPLGGYVRMVGDDPRDLEPKASQPETSSAEFLLQPAGGDHDPEEEALIADRSCWFLEKGFFTKSAVVLAGPGFNLLFAWFLAVATFWWYGAEKMLDTPVIGDTMPSLPAEKAGLRSGDRVLSINGRPVLSWEELAGTVRESGGRVLNFEVERSEDGTREGEHLSFSLSGQPEDPELSLLTDSARTGSFIIGIRPSMENIPVGFGKALRLGSYHTFNMTMLSLRSLGLMVVGAISPRNIGGPIAIMKQAARSAEKGAEKLLLFVIFLSVSLAVINLLPVPVLDGGHLLFFLIEAVRGGPVSLKVRDAASQVGLLLLLALMLFAVGNDLVNIAN